MGNLNETKSFSLSGELWQLGEWFSLHEGVYFTRYHSPKTLLYT